MHFFLAETLEKYFVPCIKTFFFFTLLALRVFIRALLNAHMNGALLSVRVPKRPVVLCVLI